MRLRTFAPALAALALAACTNPSSPPAPDASDTPEPTVTATATATGTPSSSPSASVTASPAGTMRAAVYYLGGTTSDPRLYREFRDVPRSTAVVRAAVDAMLHLAPRDSDYRSLWPRATTVRGISVSGSTATVDLSANARSVTASTASERASLQQLVHTVTAAAPNVTSVRLRFDGATKQTLWGNVSTTGAISRRTQSETLAPVWVVTPAHNTRVGRTLRVSGTASVFEATVTWAVTRPGSTAQLAHGSVNASTGAPGRGDFTVNVTLPAGVHGGVVFTAWESSAEDGRVTWPDSKSYVVP